MKIITALPSVLFLIAANPLSATTITAGHLEVARPGWLGGTFVWSITGDDRSNLSATAILEGAINLPEAVQYEICWHTPQYACLPGSQISLSFANSLGAYGGILHYTGPLGNGDFGIMYFSFTSPEFVLRDDVLDYLVPFSASIDGRITNVPPWGPYPINPPQWEFSYSGTGVAAVRMRREVIHAVHDIPILALSSVDFGFGDSAVPEPSTAVMAFMGLAALGVIGRRASRASVAKKEAGCGSARSGA